jgi:NADH-ubiquinone oxidoreductase chain 5
VPTPVSALVHSSTLVTAGVYLLIRFSPALSNFLCIFLLLFSSLTIFMAGLGAKFEYDLRKIIVLSTLSQLGLIIGAVSFGLVSIQPALLHRRKRVPSTHFMKDCVSLRAGLDVMIQ